MTINNLKNNVQKDQKKKIQIKIKSNQRMQLLKNKNSSSIIS